MGNPFEHSLFPVIFLMAARIDIAAKYLTDLVNINSPSGDEWEIVAFLADLVGDMGYTVRVEHGRGVANVVVNPRANVFFDAHTDVVQPWFPAHRDGHILYGRGTSDDKGSIASALVAMSESDLENVGFVFTADEEEEGRGADLFLDRHRPDVVFVMEPTEARVYDAQAGDVDFTAVFHGRDAHAAHLEAMDNPIIQAISVVNSISAAHFLRPSDKYRIRPGLNVLKLVGDGGGYRNPSTAELSVTIRLDPSQDVESVKRYVEDLLKEYGADCSFDDPSQGFVVPPGSRVYSIAKLAAEETEIPFGGTIHGWTYMHTYHRAGIECILIGPGSSERTHTMEEYVDLRNVLTVADFIKSVDGILSRI
jgi:acetylornithine deacetylase